MTSALHIATVTTVLRNLVHSAVTDPDFEALSGITGATVTTKPLDKARSTDGTPGNQINIFLYHSRLNSALSTQSLPPHTRPGERGHPSLPLDLFYLLTAYGADDDDRQGHRLLGQALRTLHDHPILSRSEISSALTGTSLQDQVERVRITAQPMETDEVARLWSAFQTEYRFSVAYLVSVVLIESDRPVRGGPPVLERNVAVQASLAPPFPTLLAVEPPNGQPAGRLGDTLTLRGHHLAGTDTRVVFKTSRLDSPLVVTPSSVSDRTFNVPLPNNAAAATNWVAGLYEVSVEVDEDGQTRTTEARPFVLAPAVDDIQPNPAPRDGEGDVSLTLTVRPRLRPGQTIRVLIGANEHRPNGIGGATDTLVVPVQSVDPGTKLVRLRVDGIDSLLVDYSQSPPAYDPSQTVEVT